MYPMDFEEFLWALNYPLETIQYLKDCFERRQAVQGAVHDRMRCQRLGKDVLQNTAGIDVQFSLQELELNIAKAHGSQQTLEGTGFVLL